jgi:SAM-dependent methyltransferase
MTALVSPEPSESNPRRDRQREFWRTKYAEDPTFFGDRESGFARWCVPIFRAEYVRDIVELGCGYGRDARYLAAEGFRVQGVDLTTEVAVRAGAPREPRLPVKLVEGDALGFLAALPAQTVDAVFSNMFFNMDFTETEHRELFRAVHRALRPGGLHVYSARSTSDPWYGRGTPLGPDTFDPAPHGVAMHYFSEAYADRLSRGLFVPVRRFERSEGEGDFPIRLLYVVDRRS